MEDYYIPETEFPMPLSREATLIGNYYFNLFLVRGSRKSALFETGISAVTDTVIRQLEGLEIEPDYLVPSHPHSDHITGLPGLAARYPDAEIVTAAGAPEFVAHPKAGPALLREDRFMSQALDKLGIQPGRPPLAVIPDLTGARTVSDRTTLDLGDLNLDLIPAKGHSPGNLMGQVGDILFCADNLGFHYPGRGFWPLFFTGAKDYLATLARIFQAEPAILCPAHQCPLKGQAARDAIQVSLETTHALLRRVAETELSDKALMAQLFDESYRDEFTLYTPENINNCNYLLIKRARQFFE